MAVEAIATRTIDRGVLPTADVVARVHRIQEVMRTLMKDKVHYGTIPGTPKPTLYKPGAEMLLMTFRIAASPERIEDLSSPDEIRYRVTVRGTNQMTGEVVGEMVGECSSNEEKYRWRRPVCDEEFDETPADRRREKWAKGEGGKAYKQKQVRTSPADVANTVLKMATKRALIAMTLVALGASDIFAQDLEDLAEELRDSVGDDTPKTETKQPQRRSSTGGATGTTPAPSKPVPADAEVVLGLVLKVWPGDGSKPAAIVLKGSDRKYTTFKDDVAKEAKAFEGTDHQVKLAFTKTVKGANTYYNAVGISIADAEPPKPAGAPLQQPLVADDIFGGAGREPGEEG